MSPMSLVDSISHLAKNRTMGAGRSAPAVFALLPDVAARTLNTAQFALLQAQLEDHARSA